MVSQFVSPHRVRLLSDLNYDFPEGIHAVGRLDNHSEGLLILTTNKKITKLLFESVIPHRRTYLVQVNDDLTTEQIAQLSRGVSIRIKTGVYCTTSPCEVSIISAPEKLFPLEDRRTDYPPFTWILISLTEGKYHQVRKMITAIGKKCKRLVRVSIENLELGDLKPGQVRALDEADFFELLKL